MNKTIIINGRIVLPEGVLADGCVEFADGKITAVKEGPYNGQATGTIINAQGNYVSPGFIDIHRHADLAAWRPGFGQPELRQGLTWGLRRCMPGTGRRRCCRRR